MKEDKIDYLNFLKDYSTRNKDESISLVSDRIINTNDLFEATSNSTMYIYHVVAAKTPSDIKFIKKYGLCSPQKLYEVDKELFRKYSFEIYKERAAKYFGKSISKLTDEDILEFLNASTPKRKYFDSTTIFFTFIPLTEHHPDMQKRLKPGLELTINSKVVEQYKPIIVAAPDAPHVYPTTWSKLKDDSFKENIEQIKSSQPGSKLLFIHNMHLAINCFHIPSNKISSIKYIR